MDDITCFHAHITAVEPLGYKDMVMGYSGRTSTSKVRYLTILQPDPTNQSFPWNFRGIVRLGRGRNQGSFSADVWNHLTNVKGEVFVPTIEEAERILILLVKELM